MTTSSRQVVARRVRARLAPVVADVVAAVREQVPAYATLTPAQEREVDAIAAWAVERVVELWVADAEMSEADVRRFRGIGAARAMDGRPLTGVLRAYRVGAGRVTDLVAETAGDDLGVVDALALARLWMHALDLLSEAVHEGHDRASARMVDDREAALADLLTDILSGRQSVHTALADRCRELGVDLPARPVVLVTTGTDVGVPTPVLATRHDDLEVALLREAPPGPGPARACAVVAQGVADVPRAHRLAALVVAKAPPHAGAGRLLDEGDAQVLALLRGHRDADPLRLAGAVLGDAARDPDLAATLDAWLATGSATEAAAVLGVHAQTVRHRLRRVRVLSGRHPSRPWDAFTLAAART